MLDVVKQVRAAFSLLNPDQVRKEAARPVSLGLVATSDQAYEELEDFLIPASLPTATRGQMQESIHRAADPRVPPKVDLVLYEAGLLCPAGAVGYQPDDPEATIREILRECDDLGMALARRFPVFRKAVVENIIMSVAKENTLFSVATALPNVVPNMFELPWAFGEFASDTVFLTLNQVRMAFLIAASCGAEVGLTQQKGEILSIVSAAFGWRTIARELAGKIPLGGGLIPKGAIAFAGTWVVGKGLERYHHGNVPYTRRQRDEIYQEAYVRGKQAAEVLTGNAS
ncbi:MAG TPA: hypothetical protein VG096_21335 [Bryobacteraceae bacterium]|jgi:hypothetical protein|nr:hypothetical protein [Bryobacteraceae bacterium]